MADSRLKLVLLGEDRTASKSLKGVGQQAGKTQGLLSKVGGAGKVAMAAIASGAVLAAGAAVKFGGDSLKAFADADKSQKQLEDAYKRFPKVQNVSIEALRKYNQELQRKRGIDADDTAAAQAQLGAYKLNGKQIKAMTPLLQDYAAKTGKDLPTAAKDLGKAVMGQGRALKGLGIDFKDAKDPAKNFQQVMDGLKAKVGGYADSVPEAEKKQKILAASFGDLQEAVGEKLQPAMLGLVDAGQGVLDWLNENPKAMEGASAAWDLFMMGLRGLWDLIRKLVLPAFVMVNEYGVRPFVRGLQSLFDALGNVPGFEWAKDAATKLGEVDAMVGSIDEGLNSLAKDPPEIDIDTAKAEARVKQIDKKLAELNKQKLKLKAEGDTKGVDAIENRIRKLQREKHDVKVGVGLTPKGKQKATVISTGGSGIRMRFTASGHPSLPSGGLTMVGDGMGHSPEALELPTGTRVLSYGQTAAAASRASGGAAGTVNNYYLIKGDTNPQAAARRIQQLNGKAGRTYGPGWKPPKGRGGS